MTINKNILSFKKVSGCLINRTNDALTKDERQNNEIFRQDGPLSFVENNGTYEIIKPNNKP